MKLQTAIVGASGYAGMELTRLLQRHPRVTAPVLLSPGKSEGCRQWGLCRAGRANGSAPWRHFPFHV